MFYLPPESHGLSCPCCTGGERSLLLMPIYAALMDLDPNVGVQAMRDDGEDQTGETVQATDPFYRDELALAALLGSFWLTAWDQVKPSINVALTGKLDQTKLSSALSAASATMSSVVDRKAYDKIKTAADGLIIKGAQNARGGGSSTGAGITNHVGPATVGKGTILEDSSSAQQVMLGIADATQYYSNGYFNTTVVPAIQRDIAALLDDHTGLHQPDLTPIREALDKRLASVPYWKLVANAAASRGFHYGLLKAGTMTGATGYRWVSVVDEKTSEICLDLNGREFHITDAVNLMERAASASPQQQKTIMPWPTRLQAKKIPSMTNDQLRDMGFLVPPAHGHCRSTTQLIYR